MQNKTTTMFLKSHDDFIFVVVGILFDCFGFFFFKFKVYTDSVQQINSMKNYDIYKDEYAAVIFNK